MFKNHEFRIRIAKINKSNAIAETVAEPKFEIPKDDIIDVATGLIKTSAICVVSVIAAAAVAHTASEIAIHHGTKKK